MPEIEQCPVCDSLVSHNKCTNYHCLYGKMENKWNQELGPDFSELFDNVNKQVIKAITEISLRIGKKDDKEPPCLKETK